MKRVHSSTVCGFFNMARQGEVTFRFGAVRLMRDAPLGRGAYGEVCKATLDELPCAAKLLHPILVDPNNPRNRSKFEQECRLLSELRHPNIVQYLGVAQDGEAGLPVLLMELMDNSLTHFLEQSEEPLAYHVQVNISHDIALAVAFLHRNHIIHRDLSSNNVLLIGAGCRAKVTDFGMSKLTELSSSHTPLTKCPGTPTYMAPEAFFHPPVYTEKLDCFQAGVLMVQIITRKFPDPGPAMNRVADERYSVGWTNVPVPEVERRQNHLRLISQTHPMLRLAVNCLKDVDSERPSAQEICQYLSASKEDPQFSQSLEARGGEKCGERGEERDQETEKKSEQENKEGEREQPTQVINKEKEMKEKEAQILKWERKARAKDEEIEWLKKAIESKTQLLQEKDLMICQLQQAQDPPSYTCLVSGPGQQSATVNSQTHVVVELSDSNGSPEENLRWTVTAALQFTPPAKPRSISRWPWSRKVPPAPDQPPPTVATVNMISPNWYEVCYTALRRGQHKLHVNVNGNTITGSPFAITVYPDPTRFSSPVRVVTDLNNPYGITFNSCGDMIVTECSGHRVSVFDARGQRIRTFGVRGSKPEHMVSPAGIAVDYIDNIYVSSEHKLQKFSSSWELIKCIGLRGNKEGEFDYPRGVTIHNNQVYVCDSYNHRIQVFDLDLNFVQCIGSQGKSTGVFDRPLDVKFDAAGNMYVVEYGNERVQVMDSSYHCIQVFGQEGEGALRGPTALHIADEHVYVSDHTRHCISVYQTTGQFVTSFGNCGQGKGDLSKMFPYCITSCVNGFIHVCDYRNKRVLIF